MKHYKSIVKKIANVNELFRGIRQHFPRFF